MFDGRGDEALRDSWCTAVANAARPALAHMPLVFLDRPRKELEKLEAMGLGTLGELLRLPRGRSGVASAVICSRHLDRMVGRRPDPREAVVPPETFVSTVHFLEDLEHKAALAFPMQRLLGELADWLRLRQRATDRLDWRLIHPNHGEQRIRVRFAVAQSDRVRMLEYSRLQLEREDSLPAVATLMLEVTRLIDPGERVDGLFPGLGAGGADDADVGGQDPALLVDLLRARLGDEVCRSVRPADDHRPEHAWTPVAPVPPGSGRAPGGAGRPGTRPRRRRRRGRPLWLLEPPRALASRDDRPFWHGPLTLCRGPERIDAGWWAGSPPPPRDYWVARHPDGAHLWVFRELAEGRWYLHGYFS
ncbi:MAG: hypothetical protein U5R48_07240 [Gammaproteobacteria bacterium]|nr:hypothetical protein [Gammaproteobacteria bacterium]